jgi:secreted Zn-dependent insulinase-like peptidase
MRCLHLRFADYDPELIGKLLSVMVPRSEGLRVDLVTASYDDVRTAMESLAPGCLSEGHEPWFDLQYVQMALPEELLGRWEAAAVPAELTLPVQNPFIPSDFEIRAQRLAAVSAAAEDAPANGQVDRSVLPVTKVK